MSTSTGCGKANDLPGYPLRKHTKSAALAVLAGFLALAMSSPAYAQQKTLRVAMWGEYMPLHGFAAGKAVGFEADLADLIGEYMNRRVVFVDTRGKGMSSIEAVARGEADIALNAITPTPERQQMVGFTKPYLTLHYRVMTKPDRRLASVQDLSNAKVVAPDGPALTALRGHIGDKAVPAPSMSAAIDLLKKSEVEFVFGEEVGLVAAGQGTDFILSGPSLGNAAIAAAVPKSLIWEYNEILHNIGAPLSGLASQWQPSIDPATSDGLPVSPEPRIKDEELRQFEQSFKQAVKSRGIDVPITGLEKRVVDCAAAGSGYPGRRCSEALERARGAWKGAWPAVIPVFRRDGEKRVSHVLINGEIGDPRNVSIGPDICTPGTEWPIVKKPRKLMPSDRVRCRYNVGSAWTAHTRTGHKKAVLDEIRLEPYENPEGMDTALIGYFDVERGLIRRPEPLFLSTMPLRAGAGDFVEAGKQRIDQKAVPEPVRRSFRERILRAPGWLVKSWDAYRVPGSENEAVALVVSESARQTGVKDLVIALVHWGADGNIDLLYRTDYLPSRYGDAEYCGYPDLKVNGFFDFDGDGDRDVALDNETRTANAPYLLLRVEGGFRAREFGYNGACAW